MGQNDEGDRFGTAAQCFHGGAPTPARGCIFRHDEIVTGAIQHGGQIFGAISSGMACVETYARQLAHALFGDFGLGLKK
jgi:hypothetical protein